MPYRSVIVGRDPALAGHLALANLASGQDAEVAFVACGAGPNSLQQWREWVERRATTAGRAALGQRLQVSTWDYVDSDADLPDFGIADEAWLLCEGLTANQCGAMLQALSRRGVEKFNYVDLRERAEVETFCRTHELEWRWFRVSMTVGDGPEGWTKSANPWRQFLDAVHELQGEIEERLREYFALRALGCWGAPGAKVNLVPAGAAAELMLRIARQQETQWARWDIASPQDIGFEEFCEEVGGAYGLNLLPVEEREQLNAIDRVLDRRLQGLQTYFDGAEQWEWARSYRAAGIDPVPKGWESARRESLKKTHTAQEEARKARDERVAQLSKQMQRKRLSCGGAELIYLAAGTQGPAVVFLNALGQGLYYWNRLLERLQERHRVVIWELRGVSLPPYPLGIKDQVKDLEAVLQEEGIEKCNLVAWCNSPKIAVEFYLRRPEAVSSLVFLNSTFRCAISPQTLQELDTSYARHLESLCRSLDKNPTQANAVMKALTANRDGLRLQDEMDNDQLASRVLSLVPASLKSCVLEPFRDDSTTLNYARQILDFLAYDSNSVLSQIQAPTLLIASEFDQIASPAMSRAAAQMLPKSWLLQIAGASHYCLFDRPELIACLIENFARNPGSMDYFGTTIGEVDFGHAIKASAVI